MNARILLLLLLPSAAFGQGYAGLGTTADDYLPVTAPADLVFPRDHAAHPGYRIEWWYLTATLKDDAGGEYGAQWTLFRQATAPGPDADGWENRTLWMGHAAVTTADSHLYAERFGRGGVGQAGVAAGPPFEAWIDDWRLTSADGLLTEIEVRAAGDGFALDLSARTDRPFVPQGEDGFSVKSEVGQASYYYSQPFYEVTGEIVIDGRAIAVTGQAWLDREWSSQPLAEDQEGWDWFALQLPDGGRLMAYGLRDADGAAYVVGTWISPDGAPTPLAAGEVRMVPLASVRVAGRDVPVEWRLEVPGRGLAVDTEPLNPQSWMGTAFEYWEGPIRFDGTHSGRGYLEMTGY